MHTHTPHTHTRTEIHTSIHMHTQVAEPGVSRTAAQGPSHGRHGGQAGQGCTAAGVRSTCLCH